jgi:hypothetical protein
VSLVISVSLAVVLLLTAVLLWVLASVTGLLGNFEDFWTEATGQESVSWNGAALLVSATAIAVVLVVAGTVGSWLWAILFNAASRLTGGIVVEVD